MPHSSKRTPPLHPWIYLEALTSRTVSPAHLLPSVSTLTLMWGPWRETAGVHRTSFVCSFHIATLNKCGISFLCFSFLFELLLFMCLCMRKYAMCTWVHRGQRGCQIPGNRSCRRLLSCLLLSTRNQTNPGPLQGQWALLTFEPPLLVTQGLSAEPS